MLRTLLILVMVLLTACGPKGGLDRRNDKAAEELLGILITPDEVTVPQGGSVQLTATGLYAGRETRDLTAVVDWSSKNEGIASPDKGLDGEGRFTAGTVGSTEVSARLDGVASPPAVLTVTDQTITQLKVEPSELVLEVGQHVELSAQATFSDGSRSDATGLVRWITDDGAVASLDEGLLTAGGTGSTTIHAQYEDVSSNNVRVEVLAQADPDLRIATLSASPYDGRITLVIEVENTGDSGASDFWVDGFLDFNGTPAPGDYGDVYERVAWVGPGSTKQVVLELTGVSSGSHSVTVAVDTEDEVDESDESDNHSSTTVFVPQTGGTTGSGTGSGTGTGGSWSTTTGTTWTTSTGTGTGTTYLPDLSVDSFDALSDGTWVYYEVEISNYGDQGVGPFYVDVYADEFSSPAVGDDGDDWQEVTWLGAWSSTILEFWVEIDCSSFPCRSWVQVDTLNDIAEADESDNIEGPLDVN